MSEAELRALRVKVEEQRAVIARIRGYIEPWLQDKRMRISGEILLRQIDRFEKEEAERSARGERG